LFEDRTERTGEKDVECIRGKTSSEIDADALAAGMAGYRNVLIDIGTGDGRYVLRVARTCPNWFALGVDACRENLRKASRKAPPNALYLIANALSLPRELDAVASKVTINFPWGTLLTGLLDAEPTLLEGLLAIARPGTALEIRLNAEALREAGYTLKSGVTRVRYVGVIVYPLLSLRCSRGQALSAAKDPFSRKRDQRTGRWENWPEKEELLAGIDNAVAGSSRG
jgi:Putative methyltransferase